MSSWVIYGIVALAVTLPAYLAFRWRGELSAKKADIKHLKAEAAAEMRQLEAEKAQIRGNFDDYRNIVENSGDSPAAIITKLRAAGKIHTD